MRHGFVFSGSEKLVRGLLQNLVGLCPSGSFGGSGDPPDDRAGARRYDQHGATNFNRL